LFVSSSEAFSIAAFVVTVCGKIITEVEAIVSSFSCIPSLSTGCIDGDNPLFCEKSSSFSKNFDDKIPESSMVALLQKNI
jgi:hypothetical protein